MAQARPEGRVARTGRRLWSRLAAWLRPGAGAGDRVSRPAPDPDRGAQAPAELPGRRRPLGGTEARTSSIPRRPERRLE
jgi:hypothetical protein